METKKKWYESKTIWGSIVTVGAAIGGYFGYGLDAVTQEAVINNIMASITAIGGIAALIGRIVANSKIG